MHGSTGGFRRTRWLIASAVWGGLALAACGSSTKTTTSATTVAPAASTSPSASTTSVAAITVRTASSALGTILVDAQGFTLYHNSKDTGTTVSCTATCAEIWPPLLAPSGAPVGAGISGLATLTRPEGTRQVTYNGKTLYRYSKDAKPGDTLGEGIGGIWHAVTAAAATDMTPSSASGSGY